MITLDKIKIVAPLECIAVTKQDAFEVKIKNGEIISKSYTQTNPYMLYVEIDYEDRETVIEFSGKILMDRYPELINKDNFNYCIERINAVGFCRIDAAMLCEYGRVCVIDVTKDVQCHDVSGLSEWLRCNVGNHRKYLIRNIGGNLAIEKNVVTRGYKRRLTVYEKGRELMRAENREFMKSVSDPEALQAYFSDKVRFEFNLNSRQAIRNTLNVQDTSIDEILHSAANPIYDFLNDIVVDDAGYSCTSLSERKCLAFLRDCDMDLAKVEVELRQYASKHSHISQMMRPYQALWSRLQSEPGTGFKSRLLGMVLEATIIFPIILLL